MSKEKVTQVHVHFHPAHLGASSADSALDTALRVIALAFAKQDAASGWDDPDKYGTDYENDVFFMRVDYADTDCNCEHGPRCGAWHERNPHAPECYGEEVRRRQHAWDAEHPKPPRSRRGRKDFFERTDEDDAHSAYWREQRKAHQAIARQLCRERKIDWRGGWGSAVHCDCGCDNAWKMWTQWERHADQCPHALPNFWFKPTGFRVEWYKYIGRDPRVNDSVNLGEMLDAIFATHPHGMTVEQALERLRQRSEEKTAEWNHMTEMLNNPTPEWTAMMKEMGKHMTVMTFGGNDDAE